MAAQTNPGLSEKIEEMEQFQTSIAEFAVACESDLNTNQEIQDTYIEDAMNFITEMNQKVEEKQIRKVARRHLRVRFAEDSELVQVKEFYCQEGDKAWERIRAGRPAAEYEVPHSQTTIQEWEKELKELKMDRKEVKKDRRFYRDLGKTLAKNRCSREYKERAERMYNEGKARPEVKKALLFSNAVYLAPLDIELESIDREITTGRAQRRLSHKSSFHVPTQCPRHRSTHKTGSCWVGGKVPEEIHD